MASTFFPPGILDDFCVEWFSEHLDALAEPQICSMPACVTAYRFLWLRTFDPAISVRAEIQDNRALLYTKQADGQAGFETGRVVVDTRRELVDIEWSRIVAAIQDVRFWDLTTEESKVGGIDGAEWVIEGFRAGRYHIAHRWSDEALRSIATFGLLMIELARLDIKPNDVY